MKKGIIFFLVACIFCGCKSSHPEPVDTQKDLEIQAAEQEEQLLRDVPLEDSKEIRCDMVSPNFEMTPLFKKTTRKPPVLKFSKYQLKKYICNGNYQTLYKTDTFDIDCYETKEKQRSDHRTESTIVANGFRAKYHIVCSDTLAPVDYETSGSQHSLDIPDISIICEYDYRRTSQEFGHTPTENLNIFQRKVPFEREKLSSEVTEYFCQNSGLKYHQFVTRCYPDPFASLTDFDDIMYIKVSCPGYDDEQYDESLKFRPSQTISSLKCDVKIPKKKEKIASDWLSLLNYHDADDPKIKDYFISKYCTEKIQSNERSNNFNINCTEYDVDDYNNPVALEKLHDFNIVCPESQPEEYSYAGSGKNANVSCKIDNYYTIKEFTWDVHAASAIHFDNISFDRNTLTEAVKTEYCTKQNDVEFFGSQINGKQFVVVCQTQENSNQPKESMYIKTDCKDVAVKEFQENINNTGAKTFGEMKNFVIDLTTLTGNKFENVLTYSTTLSPDEILKDKKTIRELCSKDNKMKYGDAFDLQLKEARMINGKLEPLASGLRHSVHFECEKQTFIDLSSQGSGEESLIECRTDVTATQKAFGYNLINSQTKTLGESVNDPVTGEAVQSTLVFNRQTIGSMLGEKFCTKDNVFEKPVIIQCQSNTKFQASDEEMYFKLDCTKPEETAKAQADILLASSVNAVPTLKKSPSSRGTSKQYQNMAGFMNTVEDIPYTCKLALPNVRKLILVVSDTATQPLHEYMTENWAIENFCSEQIQVEHKSSKFALTCYQTENGKPVSKFTPIQWNIQCPPMAVIDYKSAGSGKIGFVNCRTDSLHTQKEFGWGLKDDLGFAIPGDSKFNRKSLTQPVKDFLCRNPQLAHQKIVVRCELNNDPKRKVSEENIFLKINCN